MEIGDKVTWISGVVESKGVFLEDNGDGTSNIVIHFIGGQPTHKELAVNNNLIKKESW